MLINLPSNLFDGIEENQYLNELYEAILFNYSRSLLDIADDYKQFSVADALQFADTLSRSTHPTNADKHKIRAQEMAALLAELYPNDPDVLHALGSILSSVGNFRGLGNTEEKYKIHYDSGSLLEELYDTVSKDTLVIPADPTKYFFRSQKEIYDRLDDQYLSFSGPTSLGKSFVVRMFVKEKVPTNTLGNFAVLVPSKALINEVSSNIINDLQGKLAETNYRVVTSAGAIALERNHNFIFVLTPERLLYLLIRHKHIDIAHLFVDEAHKISEKNSRSAFYYKVVDMLLQKTNTPKITFASPNIPNPEAFLGLIPNIDLRDAKFTSAYSPVSQVKYLLDFIGNEFWVYNEQPAVDKTKKPTIKPIQITNFTHSFDDLLYLFCQHKMNTLVYINSKDRSMQAAKSFASRLPLKNDADLDAVAKEIRLLIHKEYFLADMIQRGVAFHVGYLPSAIRMQIEKLYRDKKIHTMFCTSTLVEGVNLPADNLFITTYRKGRGTTKLTPVDFRNLVGRVGRIEYNLYGNVFLTRRLEDENLQTKDFVELLEKEVEPQKLSLVSEIKDAQKLLIISSLAAGNVDIPKGNMTVDTHGLVRKFTLILLRDILKDRVGSAVRIAFSQYLNADVVAKIKEVFKKSEDKVDDDINASVDQTNNLAAAIANKENPLRYPPIDADGKTDYASVLKFLQELHRVFKWQSYEKSDGIGDYRGLSWYALILYQWVGGNGLSFILHSALENAKERMFSNNPKKVSLNGGYVFFDNSPLHRNLVIGEVLQSIENVVLFSFSNYFLKFSECYKKMKGIEGAMPNDWYEYVEYGTTNPLSIFLQRNGFSRETALYIRQHRADYVVNISGVVHLRRSIKDCGKDSVKKEVADMEFNAPDLFVD